MRGMSVYSVDFFDLRLRFKKYCPDRHRFVLTKLTLCANITKRQRDAGMAELADARDLKSRG